jgi:hypothetical protein
MDLSRDEGRTATVFRATEWVDAVPLGSAYNARLGVGRSSRSRSVALSSASHRADAVGSPRPMPPLAREGLERALCRVLERRHPGVRFAMKDELDAAG